MATVDPRLNSVVAHMPGVKQAVREELDERAARVQAVVDAHIFSGDLARSLTVRTNRVDSTVSIEDPMIHAINWGHRSRNGRWVNGIYVIEAGL
ncbi:DUF5403 family protein [Streptomyces sp. NPDC001828]|uniref:DUF5403 family protein n=1 Tax=Streptomyces sp. NPDC001828 TaxID=3364615 RepID=UPI003683A251